MVCPTNLPRYQNNFFMAEDKEVVAAEQLPEQHDIPSEKPDQPNRKSTSILLKLIPRFGSRKQKKQKQPSVGMITLFRFSNPRDKILICVAVFCSAAIGAIQPVSTIILGQFLRNFTALLDQGPGADILTPVIPVILVFVYLGTANLVLGYICQCCWVLSGEFQTRRIRKMYVHSILRQDMAWFDTADEGSLTTRLAADTNIIQDGISEKFGLLIQCLAQFASGFIIAFVRGWRLALVLLAALPLMGKLDQVQVWVNSTSTYHVVPI